MRMRLYTFSFTGFLLASAAAFGCSKSDEPSVDPTPPPIPGSSITEPKTGEVLPPWTEGELDIHSISTGRGETNFYIMPDGTTLLVDAPGVLATDEYFKSKGDEGATPARPGWGVSSGTVVARYVKAYAPNNKIDYWLNSHFDIDHMGNYPPDYPSNNSLCAKNTDGNFWVNGIAEIGTMIPIGKIIDRGYRKPVDRSGENRIADYIRFIGWSARTNGSLYEEAKPGSKTQITMLYNPDKYSNFNIRILCASGVYWTGTGENANTYLPSSSAELQEAKPAENIYSVAFMLNFGNFNLFSGGDLQYNGRSTYSWKDAEKPLIPIVRKVEVMKACHHATAYTNSDELLAVLKPDVVWMNPWRTPHPNPNTVNRFLAANSATVLLSTNVDSGHKAELGALADKFSSWNGHIVFRVKPDGTYRIYILDDNNEERRIARILGPYKSR